jgi:hypothetical protein
MSSWSARPAAPSATTYSRSSASPELREKSTPIASITDSDHGVTAVVGAIKAWNIISSSSTSSSAVRGTPPPIIMLHTNGNICTGSCLAATLTGCSGEYDIDGIMTHETGHIIGLGHSSMQGATMYPSVAACDFSPRTLATDDVNGRKDLYGK